MDNDDKIKIVPDSDSGPNPDHHPVKTFLDIRDLVLDKKLELYSLEKEFARLGKTKQTGLYIKMLVFIFALIAASGIIIYTVDKKNRNIDIDISDFQGFNLAEMLNRIRKIEGSISELRQEISDLRMQKDNDKDNLNDRYANEVDMLRFSGAKQAAFTKARAKLRADIAASGERYDALITEKDEQIAQLQAELGTFDQKLLDNAKKADSLADNFQKLQDIAIKKQKAFFDEKLKTMRKEFRTQLRRLQTAQQNAVNALVIKYNPVFSGTETTAALSTDGAELLPEKNILKSLADRNSYNLDNFASLSAQISNNLMLLSLLTKIDYTNSVRPAVTAIANYNQNVLDALLTDIRQKKSHLDNYRYALDHLIKSRRENGYIIDPRDNKAVTVQLDGIRSVRSGDTAMIFRGDDEYIGKIRFSARADRQRAAVIELADGKQIEPLDKILIIAKQESSGE